MLQSRQTHLTEQISKAKCPPRFDKIPPGGNIPAMNKVLKKVWAEVARGIGRAMVMSHDRPYVLPAEKSFPLDAANLRGDARRVAHDLNQQFKK